VGDRQTIELVSDVPFTLIVREGEEVLQAAVPAGVTTISR
jgi:hypothetical protein